MAPLLRVRAVLPLLWHGGLDFPMSILARYRAVTWHVLQRSVDVHEPAAVVAAVEQSKIVCELVDNQSRILIDDHDPTSHLRDDNVNRAVSIVSSIPRVRRILVPRMRECAKANNVVMEGRDIGSVVFPETPFKFYVDASPEVRVQRRRAEGQRDEIASAGSRRFFARDVTTHRRA